MKATKQNQICYYTLKVAEILTVIFIKEKELTTLLFAAIVKEPKALEFSLHPPHLTADKEGTLLPASLIPICSYQMNSTKLGREVGKLNFTLCDSFKPTVHQGQLCYSLQLNRKDHGKSRIRKENGLLLLLDPQLIHGQLEHEERKSHGEHFRKKAGLASIFLDTLAPFSDNQEGNYALTGLKWMNGTDTFMELSNEEKECQRESFEECQREKVAEDCGCLPWQLMFHPSGKDEQVSLIL